MPENIPQPPSDNQPQPSFLQKLLNMKPPTGASTGAASQEGGAKPTITVANGNVFTKLFGVTSAEPKVQKQANPMTLTSAPTLSSMLGPKPVFSRETYEANEAKLARTGKIVFQVALVVAVIVYGYFYTQLSTNFTWFADQLGPNVETRFVQSNGELQTVQTELNLTRYRMARLWLDDVNGQIDPFQSKAAIVNSSLSTDAQKALAQADLQKLGAGIKKSLGELQKIFNQPLGIDTFARAPVTPEEREAFYASLLAAELNSQKTALSNQQNPNTEEIGIVDNVLRLVQNETFRNTIRRQDLANIKDQDLSAMLTTIRAEGTDELSLIDKIRKKRLDWGSVISDIHTIVSSTDAVFGKGLFKSVGGLLFSSYRFDSKTGRISITGLTKTSDSKTFSFIAKLIDSIEKSPKFKDIDYRSFSKSRDETGDYSSSVNLDFTLQGTGEKDPRDDVSNAK